MIKKGDKVYNAYDMRQRGVIIEIKEIPAVRHLTDGASAKQRVALVKSEKSNQVWEILVEYLMNDI